LCWSKVPAAEQQVVFRFIASSVRFFVHHLTYLDQVPRLNQLNLNPDAVDRLHKILIPDLKKRWEALSNTDRDSLWSALFAQDQFVSGSPNTAYPTDASWESVTEEQLNAATVVWQRMPDREKIFNLTTVARRALEEWLVYFKADAGPGEVENFEKATGLYFHKRPGDESLKGLGVYRGKYLFEVHSFRGAQRVAPDGTPVNRVIVSITQKRKVKLDETITGSEKFVFRGGCTLIFDLNTLQLKYLIKKPIDNHDGRLTRQRDYRKGEGSASLRMTYFGPPEKTEPFALLHSDV
jgi:hypothetical protein